MGSISIEMWRTRIGGFSASNYKAKSASTLETSPKYKRRTIIFVFIICFVSIAFIITLNNREQLNTANYPNINDNSTPRSSNGTTIDFETTPFSNTTTPPPTAEERFFDTADTIIFYYLSIISLLNAFYLIEYYRKIQVFKKGSWVTSNEWPDFFWDVTFIFSNMNLMFFPIIKMGIVFPWGTKPEIACRVIVKIGLLSSMILFLMCILICLLVILTSVCMDTTSLKIHFNTLLKMMEAKSEKNFEIMFRLIIVMIRLVIKILLMPISFINKKCKTEWVRTEGEQERTIKEKILISYIMFVKTLKYFLPLLLNLMLLFFVGYQNDRNVVILIIGAVFLIAFAVFTTKIIISISFRTMQTKEMKTQKGGDFYNGLPEVDSGHCERLQSVLATITRNTTSFSMVRHDKASDSLCKCRLKLGSSDTYKKLVTLL